ncbi:MAG TPA: formylglycine-generating enzyme family protein, partial [Candidatus Sumerlaeota bacterium]|nr:formylglycine-generating enzyme family protein [Candidatus Sumerlaeota bacterium]
TQAGSEVNLEAKPWITVSAPADCSSENIEIPFVLYHDQSRPTNIYVQHSLDGGNTWSWSWTTRDIMECMRNLASAPNGVQHFFPWYSARQAPCNLYENVRVRILPWNSTENGAWASTEDFCMDNLLQITWLSNYGATRTNRFQIPIYYRLVDCTGEATNIYCKYSIDGGNTWNWAWQAPGGEGQTNLSTSPEGVLHTFMWDAARNLPDSHYPDVRFAILPYNTKGMSGFWKSSPFEVINSRAPWVSLYMPENPAQGEVVRVYMRVMDYQSLPTNVRGWYSVDGGEVWWEATSPDGDNLLSNLASSPAGVLQYFPWDAPSDLGEGMFGNVKFAVSADNPNGEGDREETASFKIGIPVIEERTIILRGNVRLELIRIPQGDFQMGSPDTERNRTDREGPLHTVNISYDSYMGKYEVTQSQWEAVMGKGNWPGTSPTSELGRGDSYPMYYVSWNDAINFIATLNKHITATSQGPLTIRLPSEAEWEYACRSATQTRFHFGASLSMADECEDDGIRSQYMWYCGNNKPDGTKPVGQKRPNAFGLYDMSGNVYEWCEDDYHDIYTGAPVGGSAWIEQPRNATRIIRGGYWGSDAAWCRSATRGSHAPIYRGNYTGFRVAADKQEAVPTP